MTTELVIRNGDAALVLTADSEFEMETIERLQTAFPKKEIQISLDWKDWNPQQVKSAKILVSFFPEPPRQTTEDQLQELLRAEKQVQEDLK